MATIAENLKSIADSKAAIKTAIQGKGVAVADSDAFSTYAGKIDSIKSADDVRGKMLTAYINGETVDIDDSDITQICNMANSANVRTLNIPSVTTLASYSLKNCSGLETVNIDNVTSIGAYTFSYCTSLKTISMPAIITFSVCSFIGCTALTSVSIGSAVKIIYTNVFNGCTALTTININRKQDAIAGSPWGAPSTCTVNWTGDK